MRGGTLFEHWENTSLAHCVEVHHSSIWRIHHWSIERIHHWRIAWRYTIRALGGYITGAMHRGTPFEHWKDTSLEQCVEVHHSIIGRIHHWSNTWRYTIRALGRYITGAMRGGTPLEHRKDTSLEQCVQVHRSRIGRIHHWRIARIHHWSNAWRNRLENCVGLRGPVTYHRNDIMTRNERSVEGLVSAVRRVTLHSGTSVEN